MTVNVSKPAINVREKLAELDKPTGIAGEAMLRAETPQEQFNLIGAGRRNLIINGDMRIAQRGTSFTGLSGGNNQYTLDRWQWIETATPAYTMSVEQSTTSPEGFGYSTKITTTTGASLASDDLCRFWQPIEAQDLQHLSYGSNDARYITLSFWVRSNVTGAYVARLNQQDGSRDITATYTIDTADTWEYKTLTFVGDPSGTINNDNGIGLRLEFVLLSGSDYTSTASTSWGSAASSRFAYGQTASINNTNDTFYITGVQLELGKVATPFEHRSYGEELALCQRYYYQAGGETTSQFLATGQAYSTTQFNGCVIPFPVTMRDAPEMSYASAANFKVQNSSGSGITITSLSISTGEASARSASVRGVVGSGLVAGNATMLYTANTSGILKFDAEL